MDYKHLITANAEMAKIEERLSRYFVEGQAQHVIQRGNNRDIIFVCDKDYLFYLECLSEAATQHKLMIHSYVLMTNHVHLLVTPETKESLPKVLQSEVENMYSILTIIINVRAHFGRVVIKPQSSIAIATFLFAVAI